jgi:hypothetical protein
MSESDVDVTPSGLAAYYREAIAAVVAIGFGLLGWQFTSSAGMAAGSAALTSLILTPVLVYPIPKRWKILFCALPNIAFAASYTFSNGVNDRGILTIWALGVAIGALVGGSLMLVERQYKKHGFLAALLVALAVVILFSLVTVSLTWT